MTHSPERPDLPSQVLAEQFHIQLPSLPHWIEAAAEYLRQRAILCGVCGEARSGKLLIAFHEAIANAVIHGNLGVSSALKENGDDSFARALAQRAADPNYAERSVSIAFDYDGRRCRWTIQDEGAGFDVDNVLARCLSDDPEVMLASGRGILMMHSFMDELRYENGGRCLVLGFERESGRERRRGRRRAKHEPLRIVPIRQDGSVDWEAAYHALARDFSSQGVGLFQEELARTDRILIGMNVAGTLVYMPARVRHCRAVGSDLVELGCAFLSDQEAARMRDDTVSSAGLAAVHAAIEGLLGALPPLPTDERRAHSRVVFNGCVEILPLDAAAPVVGYARDLSRGGVAVVTTTTVPLDAAVVSLVQEKTEPLRIRGRVVRCDHIDGKFYDVGIQFVALD